MSLIWSSKRNCVQRVRLKLHFWYGIRSFAKMQLKIFKYCWKRSVLLRGTKILVFLILLTTVIHQYALDIYTKYHDKTTVFVSQTYPIDNFTLPFTTICIVKWRFPKKSRVYQNFQITQQPSEIALSQFPIDPNHP